MKRIPIVLVIGLLCLFSTNVQANIEDDIEDLTEGGWEEILLKAHDIQSLHAEKSSQYHYIREDFLSVFTKDLMMEMFKEHLFISGEGYQFASTDFSPYMIHSLQSKRFDVKSVSNDELLIEESRQDSSELMGTQIPQQRITIVNKENGLKISSLKWVYPNQ
ncbi:hypothetical protein GLW08_02490 [Pontibacillus yanchengensis]|uniref:Uncharacterized protein n=2 Tax=Pontibacillus yanchengensis TaxID=462910 RepID=A0ACC7VBT8_9BACI|nr:hypothetical protein [Pontibacillus yanchengensis]MYL34810.1 hypothetical protein [Pontibacillus yanchengensis]MYL52203.1 hypothetical protein [Pontibacillus yanchengensis]